MERTECFEVIQEHMHTKLALLNISGALVGYCEEHGIFILRQRNSSYLTFVNTANHTLLTIEVPRASQILFLPNLQIILFCRRGEGIKNYPCYLRAISYDGIELWKAYLPKNILSANLVRHIYDKSGVHLVVRYELNMVRQTVREEIWECKISYKGFSIAFKHNVVSIPKRIKEDNSPFVHVHYLWYSDYLSLQASFQSLQILNINLTSVDAKQALYFEANNSLAFSKVQITEHFLNNNCLVWTLAPQKFNNKVHDVNQKMNLCLQAYDKNSSLLYSTLLERMPFLNHEFYVYQQYNEWFCLLVTDQGSVILYKLNLKV